jgi:hypothetical protein
VSPPGQLLGQKRFTQISRPHVSGLANGRAGLFPPPALGERYHRSLARRRIAVRQRAVFEVVRSTLIGSASAAIKRFANSVGNDTRPSSALSAADEIPQCIVVCDGQGAYLARSAIQLKVP